MANAYLVRVKISTLNEDSPLIEALIHRWADAFAGRLSQCPGGVDEHYNVHRVSIERARDWDVIYTIDNGYDWPFLLPFVSTKTFVRIAKQYISALIERLFRQCDVIVEVDFDAVGRPLDVQTPLSTLPSADYHRCYDADIARLRMMPTCTDWEIAGRTVDSVPSERYRHLHGDKRDSSA